MWWTLWWACGADPAASDTPAVVEETDAAAEETDVAAEETDAVAPPDDDPPLYDDPCVTQAPEVVIGTGEDAFEEVAPGGALPLWQGSQAGVGFHFFLSLRATFVPQLVRIQYGVRDVATGEALDEDPDHDALNLALATETLGAPWACEGFQRGIQVRVRTDGLDEEPQDAPEDLCGREVELWVRLNAVDGTLLVEDALRAVARQDAAHLVDCPEWTLVIPEG
jgi:hypothetical protein